MIPALVAALSVAASTAIDVPYLPQSEALCGGAAAAMVFRFWGDVHADPQEFARLIDRRAGGIADNVLADAVRARGWRVTRLANGTNGLQRQLEEGQPVILLLSEHGARYHYVVATARTSTGVVIHDPSWGPSREIKAGDFERRWQAAGYWGLIVRPPVEGVPSGTRAELSYAPRDSSRCAALLSAAINDVQHAGFDHAEAALDPVRKACPESAGAWRELAGVRFAQKRWADAATLARQALDRDPADPYAWDLLGSSLFMQDDVVEALHAWNRIGKPRVNLVRIEGLHHTRYETLADLIGIRPNALLTADAFARAERRLDDLPDRSTVRLTVRPESDGFATVEVAVVEHDIPRNGVEWAAEGAHAAVTRTIAVAVPGGTGQGEMWSAEWRFWPNRPRVDLAFTAPHVIHLPGSWRIDGAWESQTFLTSQAGSSAPSRQSRTHGALTTSNWLSGRIRYSVTAGLDAWDGGQKAATLGGALEQRWFNDRASVEIHAADGLGLGASDGFHSAGVRLHLQSSAGLRDWVALGTAGTDHVSDGTPMDLWLAADDGHVGTALLRAHPILEGGAIETGGASAFGRSLTYATAEIQRWFDRPLLPRIGVAGFVDAARASRRAAGDSSPTNVDVGGGVRFRVPGQPGVLRVDIARGVLDGANALTVGWQF